ncbi:MAG: hypothetical protein RPU52_09870 [Candidatus Sedimenticola sp. (ex Thyasira tokunagai)]
MKLESEVMRELIKTMPRTFVQRLRNDDEFVTFSELPLIRFGELGSFEHDTVLMALARAKETGKRVELIARNGKQYFLERSLDGVRITPADRTGSELMVKEFSFFDPDREVRLGALKHAMEQCWPSFPSISQWQSILDERPLSEIELAKLISGINDTPGHFMTVMASKWSSGGEMDAASFFPTSLAYYEALVGPPQEGLGADAWINSVLIPHIKQHLDQSLIVGLKLALALNIDPRLCPAGLVSSTIPDDELIVALRELAATRSPLALLGLLEIAISRTGGNERFREFASDILDRLVGDKSREIRNVQAWQLMPVIIKVGLRKLSIEERLCCRPPCWRRLAAFAHAHILVEILEAESEDFDQFIGWMDGLERPEEFAAILLDFKKEPMWHVLDMTPRSLKALVVRRLITLKDRLMTSGLELQNGHLVDLAFESTKNEGGLLDIPGLLHDGTRVSDMDGCDRSKSDSETSFISEAVSALELEPLGTAWNGLALACRHLCFDDALLESLTKLPTRLTLGDETEDRERFFDVLEKAAEIAATQPCEALADAVADAITREAVRFAGARDAEVGYMILIMSSGAITDDTRWKEWIGKRMTDYAFFLPKGEACSQLLLSLDSLQTLMPIKDRCFGRARKFASSGI